MATTVSRRFRAMAAVAMVLGLLGCSGTESDEPSVLVAANPTAVALSGQAVDRGTDFAGRPRMRALAAPASESVTKPVIDFSFALVNGGIQTTLAASSATAVSAETSITNSDVLDWAERTYPEQFPPKQSNLVGTADGNTYDYRNYAGNLLGIRTAGTDVGGVYGVGPYTGNELRRFGHVDDFIGAAKCQIKPTICVLTVQSADLVSITTGQVVASVLSGNPTVHAKGTKLRITYDQALNCAGVGGTGVLGQIVLTVACSGQALTFTPGFPGEERWVFGAVNTVTVAGVRSLDGNYPSTSMSVSFATRSAAAGSNARVYVANYEATAEGGHDVSVINTATQAVVPVNLADVLNGVVPQRLTVDPQAGVVYVGAGGDRFYRIDIETGVSLAPLYPDPTGEYPGYWHTVQGLVIAGQDICAAMGRQDFAEYVYRNRLLCWNRFTLQPSFRSNSDYLAGRQMVVMAAVAVPERNTFYVLAADAMAYNFMVDSTGRHLKQDFDPGTAGTVYEVNADTKAVVQTYSVGAGPRSAVYDAARKRLIVANSGKTAAGNIELSVIDLETRRVTPKRLPGFTGDQRPQHLVLAKGDLWVTDYVSSVAALDLATLAEKRRVQVGDFPVFFAGIGDQLYVPLPRDDKMSVIDLRTNSLASLIPVGRAPWYVTGFTPAAQ